MRLTREHIFTLLISLTFGPISFAQPKNVPLRIEDAIGVRRFPQWAPISLSSDDGLVAYTLQDESRVEGLNDPRYRWFTRTGVPVPWSATNVWITNTRTGQSKNLTQSKGSAWDPVWSPDGKTLAFYSDLDGAAHLWIWDRLKRLSRRLSPVIVHPYFGFEAPVWSPDGKRILVKILPEGLTVEQATDLLMGPKQAKETERQNPTVKVYSSIAPEKVVSNSVSDDTPAFVKVEAADLAMIDVATGAIQRIARGYRPEGYWISPDGSHAAFSAYKIVRIQNSPRGVYDLMTVALPNGQPRIAAANVHMDYGLAASWSPDGKFLAYTDARPDPNSRQNTSGECFLVSAEGGEPRQLTQQLHPTFSRELRAPIWDAKGEHLYFLAGNAIWKVTAADGAAVELAKNSDRRLLEIVSARVGGGFYSPDDGRSMIVVTRDNQTRQVGFYRVDLDTGSLSRLFEENKSYGADTFSIDAIGNDVVYISEDAGHAPDLWVARENFQNLSRLTHVNPAFDTYMLSTSRLIEYQDAAGKPLRGALLLPSNYQQSKPAPMVVVVYGGSNGSNAVNRFGLYGTGAENCQLLSTRGYAVLFPDTPLRTGSPVEDLARTVMPAVDKAIELGIADPHRIGVMGHSYGGYSTLSLIVQTHRFKAAVDSAGAGNLLNMYSQMREDGSAFGINWAEKGQGLMGGSPWEFRERYIENSPAFFLDRVETPLLILQGESDQTTPPFATAEVFVDLRRLGKEAVYARYPGEDHDPNGWTRAHRLDYVNRIVAWFDKYLRVQEGSK